MSTCYEGTSVPERIIAPCGGEYLSAACVVTPSAIPELSIQEGSTQEDINTAIKNAIVHKDEQITPYVNRKIFRGSFLDAAFITILEDTIDDVVIGNTSTGNYSITSDSFNLSTLVVITPNGVGLGYEDITITYDYTNIATGVIRFKVKNNGILVNLLESPIKIEA